MGSAFHIFTPTQDDDNLNMIGGNPGEICWMELMVDDPALIMPFYAGLFGWDFSAPMPMNGGEYIKGYATTPLSRLLLIPCRSISTVVTDD